MAAAQTMPRAGDVDANLREHLALVQAAAAEGVSLLVFPELSLTGYELHLGSLLAFEVDDIRLLPLRAAARNYDITLVVGAPLRSVSGLHIAAFIIEPEGRVHVYTKHHLGAFRREDNPGGAVPEAEESFFCAGNWNPLVAWKGRKVAVSICADSAHPSHAQAAAALGADVYVSCQFAIAAHMGFKVSRLKEAARRHGFAVVFSNYGAPTGGLAAAGGSSIRGPDGGRVAQLPAEGCGLAIGWEEASGWTGRTVQMEVPWGAGSGS